MAYPTTGSAVAYVASTSLAAGASANYAFNFTNCLQGHIQVSVTNGSTVSATRGAVLNLRRYWGPEASLTQDGLLTRGVTLPMDPTYSTGMYAFIVGTGFYNLAIGNLDPAYAITYAISYRAIPGIV